MNLFIRGTLNLYNGEPKVKTRIRRFDSPRKEVRRCFSELKATHGHKVPCNGDKKCVAARCIDLVWRPDWGSLREMLQIWWLPEKIVMTTSGSGGWQTTTENSPNKTKTNRAGSTPL